MKLLVVVMNSQEHVQDVLEAFLELDVRGATIINTEGVMQLLAEEAPIFAGLRHMFSGSKEHNKTIFGLTDRDEILKELGAVLNEVDVDLTVPGTGYAFTVSVDGAIESKEEE